MLCFAQTSLLGNTRKIWKRHLLTDAGGVRVGCLRVEGVSRRALSRGTRDGSTDRRAAQTVDSAACNHHDNAYKDALISDFASSLNLTQIVTYISFTLTFAIKRVHF